MRYRFIDTDDKHLHTLDGEPLVGTTTAIKNVMPPFLAKWGALCCVNNIRTRASYSEVNGVVRYEVTDKLLEESINAWTKERKKKADTGKKLHSDLEEYVKFCIKNHEGVPQDTDTKSVLDFAKWSKKNVKRFIHAEASVFSKRLWLGGQLDVVFERNDGVFCIGDFKSNKDVFMNMFFQCCLYDIQQSEHGFFTEDGFSLGEPLEIGAYHIFTFGDGFKSHDYVASDTIREAAEGIIKINNLLPKK